jgi:hypothetical protein
MLDSPLLTRDDSIINSVETKIYAEHRPKIMLEVLSAQTAGVVLIFTYISFIFCFAIDISNTARAFSDTVFVFKPTSCSSTTNQITNTSHPFSSNVTWAPSVAPDLDQVCQSSDYLWNNTVYDLSNVISVELTVSQSNFTGLTNWSSTSSDSCTTATASYDVTLWACYQSNGCTDFSSSAYDNSQDTWHRALILNQQLLSVDLCSLVEGKDLDESIFPNTFQNQVHSHIYIYILID